MSVQENTQNRGSWAVAFGEFPRHHSRAMYQLLDFTGNASIEINLTFDQQQESLEFVQAIYIDNSSNTAALTCYIQQTQQQFIVKAGLQGYYPVLAPMQNCKIKFSTASTAKIPVEFLSMPMAPQVWDSGLQSSGNSFIQGGSAGLDYSANKPAVYANLLGTIPVNAGRAGVSVQNQSSDTIQAMLDDGTGANISIILLAPGSGSNTQGGYWESLTFKGRVRVYGPASSDQVFIHQD